MKKIISASLILALFIVTQPAQSEVYESKITKKQKVVVSQKPVGAIFEDLKRALAEAEAKSKAAQSQKSISSTQAVISQKVEEPKKMSSRELLSERRNAILLKNMPTTEERLAQMKRYEK